MHESRSAGLLMLSVVVRLSRISVLIFIFRSGTPAFAAYLHRDGRFDRWMRLIADEFEIFELELVNVFYVWIQFHPW